MSTLSPEEAEAQALAAEKKWLDEVYQPNAVELTVRAIITGMVVGCLMCFANLYVVLKTGWSVGVTITACIMAWSFWSAVSSVLGPKWRMGILENNAMGSVASAAGYMTGGGNMAADKSRRKTRDSSNSVAWNESPVLRTISRDIEMKQINNNNNNSSNNSNSNGTAVTFKNGITQVRPQ